MLSATRRDLAGHDLVLVSAGAALFGAVAAVPALLVAIALGRLVFGPHEITRYGARLARTIPSASGASHWVAALFTSAGSLSVLGVIFAVVMASAYGQGLSRALCRFAPPEQRDLPPAWRSRLRSLPVLGLTPLLLIGLLVIVPWVSDLQSHGALGVVVASYLGLNVVWLLLWPPITWVFRVVAPGRPSWKAAIIGGGVTAAFVSGFLQGFTLFLALPVDLGRPFGGLPVVGVTVSLLLWEWVLHAVVCVGYTLTWSIDAALGSPPAGSPDRGASRRRSLSG